MRRGREHEAPDGKNRVLRLSCVAAVHPSPHTSKCCLPGSTAPRSLPQRRTCTGARTPGSPGRGMAARRGSSPALIATATRPGRTSPGTASAAPRSSPSTMPASMALVLFPRMPRARSKPGHDWKPMSGAARPRVDQLARHRRRRRLGRRDSKRQHGHAHHVDAEGAVLVVASLRGRRRIAPGGRPVCRGPRRRGAHRENGPPHAPKGVRRCNGRAGGAIVIESVRETGFQK